MVHRPDDPAAYARKILVNRRRSLLRRAGVEARFLAGVRAEVVPPPGDEAAMVLRQAVQDLPPRQRAVLVLRFHEDLTEAEVARLLGLPLGTVKSLGHRGLARLRQRLGTPDLDPTRATRRETP
jgi:RNA polymerase sigma factor (sigma-70 family)